MGAEGAAQGPGGKQRTVFLLWWEVLLGLPLLCPRLLSVKREVPAGLWPLQSLTCFDSPSTDSLCCVVLSSALEGRGGGPSLGQLPLGARGPAHAWVP